jgi:chromate transporter
VSSPADPVHAAPPASRPPAFAGARAAPASCTELFRAFNRMALQGFGGVLAVAQHELVDRLGWLTRAQFVELLSMSQVLPGPNIVNLALMMGDRYFGRRGALAALAGMMLVPLVIVLLLATLYGHFSGIPQVAGALRGMGAVAAGLVVATSLKLLPTLKGNVLGPAGCTLLALGTIVTVAVLRLPLLWVVLGLGGLGMAAAWWRLRR